MRRFHPLLIALQFLTRLPVRLRGIPEPLLIGRSLLYYPLVGLILGSVLAALNLALGNTPGLLHAALLLTAWVLLTGALHLDGLADSADAWVGGLGDRERTLTIMKDPYCGPAAVTTLIIVLLIKFSTLHSLGPNGWLTLLIVPTLARGIIPLLFLTTPYVRPGGLGSALAAHLPRTASIAVIVATGAAVLLAYGQRGFWLLLITAGTFQLLRTLMIRRLGGTTGDTAGAMVELIETTLLTAATLLQ
ncbi:MAG: adenosylcobinamide-GDP ribazoletransferase [Sulfuricaulis sp.]